MRQSPGRGEKVREHLRQDLTWRISPLEVRSPQKLPAREGKGGRDAAAMPAKSVLRARTTGKTIHLHFEPVNKQRRMETQNPPSVYNFRHKSTLLGSYENPCLPRPIVVRWRFDLPEGALPTC